MSDTYETSRLPLAVYLILRGEEPIDRLWVNGKCQLVFNSNEEVERLVGRFETGNATVDPDDFSRVFQETLKEVREAA